LRKKCKGERALCAAAWARGLVTMDGDAIVVVAPRIAAQG